MTTIGIIGLGTMGRVHYEAYQQIPQAQVIAVADSDPVRARGDLAGTAGNILGDGIRHLPMERITGYTDYHQLLADPAIEVVDICLPTPFHRQLALEALAHGKHVMLEKPMARTSADARAIVDAAARSRGFLMPAMCMRFWPGWSWLKQVVAQERFGRVRAASFTRLASTPAGWYHDGAASGGALLDLHIHDVDFVQWLFGSPTGVFSRGYTGPSGAIDHLSTQYLFPSDILVTAEGGWAMSDGYGFTMRYTINCESATIDFDLARAPCLRVTGPGAAAGGPPPACEGAGYVGELRYFLDCVAKGVRPSVVTPEDGLASVRICEAELRSIASKSIATLVPEASARAGL